MANPLCHFEFMTDDEEKCKAFYGAVFDWSFDNSSMPGYTLIQTGSQPGGGVMKRPAEAPEPAFNAYFLVDDMDATLAKIAEAGGTIVVPKTPIPKVGYYAIFLDPEHICLGLFQSEGNGK